MRTLIEWSDGALTELRDAVRAAGRPSPRDRRADADPVRTPELIPVVNAGDVDAPEGGLCEFGAMHEDGYSVLAHRPRRSGLSSVGIFAGAVPAGMTGWAWHLAGTVLRSAPLGGVGAQPGDRIGAVADSFAGAPNPLGRFLLRGYDAGEAIIEITEPPVDRKLVQLPTGQIVSVREIEAGQEYTVTQDAAGQFVWTRAE